MQETGQAGFELERRWTSRGGTACASSPVLLLLLLLFSVMALATVVRS
jgi:hypothetical protein